MIALFRMVRRDSTQVGKMALVLASLLMMAVTLAQPAGAQDGGSVVIDPTSCGHFSRYDDAQAAFDDGSVSNPEHLDADGDGIVCEDLFGVGDGELTEDRFTCDDFTNAEEAQAFFDDEATDLQRDILDVDEDGLACENAFGQVGSGVAQQLIARLVELLRSLLNTQR